MDSDLAGWSDLLSKSFLDTFLDSRQVLLDFSVGSLDSASLDSASELDSDLSGSSDLLSFFDIFLGSRHALLDFSVGSLDSSSNLDSDLSGLGAGSLDSASNLDSDSSGLGVGG